MRYIIYGGQIRQKAHLSGGLTQAIKFLYSMIEQFQPRNFWLLWIAHDNFNVSSIMWKTSTDLDKKLFRTYYGTVLRIKMLR